MQAVSKKDKNLRRANKDRQQDEEMIVDDAKAIKSRKIVKTKKRNKETVQAHKKEDEEEKEIMNAELELEDSGSDEWEDVEEVV